MRGRKGFTIIELLTAMTLFLTLGIALFGMLRSGLGLFRQGESRRSGCERAIALLEAIAADLRAACASGGSLSPDPDILLLGDRDAGGRARLRFVRSIPRELADETTRLAGSVPGASEDLDFASPADLALKAGEGKLRGLRGLAEVAYVCEPDPDAADGAPLFLRRGMFAPPGGEASLMKDVNLKEERLAILSQGILFFGVEFLLDGEDPEPLDEWDSTLGRLKEFRFFAGPDSLADTRDDVYPRAVRITFTIEKEERGLAEAKLDAPVTAADRTLPISGTKDMPGPGDAVPFVKIGDEWIRIAGKDSRSITAAERGARSTAAARHERGAKVHWGDTFSRWVELKTRGGAIVR